VLVRERGGERVRTGAGPEVRGSCITFCTVTTAYGWSHGHVHQVHAGGPTPSPSTVSLWHYYQAAAYVQVANS
jgi:hypothetical protein